MSDALIHLRDIERVAPPDLWPDIETRVPRRAGPEPDAGLRRRLVVILVVLAIAAAAIALAVRAFLPSRPPVPIYPGPGGFLVTVFPAQGNGNAQIVAVTADGRVSGPLTSCHPPACLRDVGPALSPDGTKVAFSRVVGRMQGSIWVMDLQGRSPRQITTCARRACVDEHPQWSPDGSTIVFQRRLGGTKGPGVFVVNADGSGLRRVTNLRGWYPTWSQDGSRIAFASPTVGLFVVNQDGSGLHQILSCPAEHCHTPVQLAWSPDGSEIAFANVYPPEEIAAVRPDGSGLHPIIACAQLGCGNVWSPVWSKDGKRLAFIAQTGHGAVTNQARIYTVDRDGGGPREVAGVGSGYGFAWEG
jgi:hypothetical protein